MVKIIKVELIPVMISLKSPFIISLETIRHAHNVVVKLHTSDGTIGWGESSPYRTINGETQETNMAVGRLLAKIIKHKTIDSPSSCNRLIDNYIAGNTSIKNAFDMAIYDIFAQKAGLPLYQYLGASEQRTDVYTDMTVSLMSADDMAAKAKEFVEAGFPFLKVKVGRDDPNADIERLVAIRDAISDDIPMRLDANQGWSYANALHILQSCAELNIEHCEEPIDHADIQRQALLSSYSPIPIMADECVFTSEDMARIIQQKAAQRVNIKLGKAGGLTEAMRIADLATKNNMICQVGSFSESRLGITALTHFAMGHSCVQCFDLDAPLMLSEDPVIGGMIYHDDWQVTLPDTIGLGATYDEAFLKQFSAVTI